MSIEINDYWDGVHKELPALIQKQFQQNSVNAWSTLNFRRREESLR